MLVGEFVVGAAHVLSCMMAFYTSTDIPHLPALRRWPSRRTACRPCAGPPVRTATLHAPTTFRFRSYYRARETCPCDAMHSHQNVSQACCNRCTTGKPVTAVEHRSCRHRCLSKRDACGTLPARGVRCIIDVWGWQRGKHNVRRCPHLRGTRRRRRPGRRPCR